MVQRDDCTSGPKTLESMQGYREVGSTGKSERMMERLGVSWR